MSTNDIITQKDLMRFQRLMSQYKLAIKSNMKRYGKWCTGKTWNSIEPKAYMDGDILVCELVSDEPIPVAVQETGRKPGKVASNFEEIIYQWSIDKGIQFADDNERWKFARAVKWKTIKEGSVQFRQGTNYDIYTSLEKQYQAQIIKGVNSIANNKLKQQLKIFDNIYK